MKKILSLALVLIMVLSLAVGASATSINVKNDEVDPSAHHYYAYQIFKGTLHAGVLSDIVWGDGITAAGADAIQTAHGVTDAAGIAALLTEANVAEFAKEFGKALSTTRTALTTNTATDVPAPGYYLVKEESSLGDTTHAATSYIMEVVGAVTVSPKSSAPTMDKKQSTNPSGYTHDGLKVGMSDIVYYELTGTLPNTLSSYNTYKYWFHDKMSAGLTYQNDAKVLVDGTDVTGSFTITHSAGTLKIGIDDIKTIAGINKDSVVKVYFTAKVNSNAVVGNPGNPNDAYLQFSNDPTFDGTPSDSPTGNTPEVRVLVFTVALEGTKVDKTNNDLKLENAKFVLKNADGKFATLDADKKITGWKDTEAEATVVTTGADGKFAFIGLNAGNYQLVETAAPAGYNKPANPFELKILITVEGSKDLAKISNVKVDLGSEQHTGDPATGVTSVMVRNTAGTTLPSTGGIGTTIFYVLGSILVVGAVVLLVSKKRMGAM